MSETPQLTAWQGQFGDQYIGRNNYDQARLPFGVRAWDRMLGQRYPIRSALEVGCNVGLNLWFLRQLWDQSTELYAVEPNGKALETLRNQSLFSVTNTWQGNALNLPLDDNSVDLVFTSGVLIHIHPDDLPRAVDEIFRVSRRYILCSEYFSREPVELPYHGQAGLLFKRDFGRYYLSRFPALRVVDYGFLWEQEFQGFDDLTWWLFEKDQC